MHACVCVCWRNLTCKIPPTVCAHESISSHCSDLGLGRFAYNSTKQAYHRDLWSMCKHLFMWFESAVHSHMPRRRDERRLEMKRKDRMRKKQGTSGLLLMCEWKPFCLLCFCSPPFPLAECVCVCIALFLCFHSSCAGISLPNGK